MAMTREGNAQRVSDAADASKVFHVDYVGYEYCRYAVISDINGRHLSWQEFPDSFVRTDCTIFGIYDLDEGRWVR
jgi:hypothetical protein